MEIIYLPKADEDLDYWIKTGNKAVLKKIAQLT
jgi:toxin YoeB